MLAALLLVIAPLCATACAYQCAVVGGCAMTAHADQAKLETHAMAGAQAHCGMGMHGTPGTAAAHVSGKVPGHVTSHVTGNISGDREMCFNSTAMVCSGRRGLIAGLIPESIPGSIAAFHGNDFSQGPGSSISTLSEVVVHATTWQDRCEVAMPAGRPLSAVPLAFRV